ncbi:hypothetical protein FOMPIDRAFT_117848, partial [Fomitopsis schrenkii]
MSKPARALPASAPPPARPPVEKGEAKDVEEVAEDELVSKAPEHEEAVEEMAEPEVQEGYDDLFAENAGEADDEDKEDNRTASSQDESGHTALPARPGGFDYNRTAKAPRVSFRFERESQSDMDEPVPERRFGVKAGMKPRNLNDAPAPYFQGLDMNMGLDGESSMSPRLGENARLDAVLEHLAMLERNVGDTEALLHEYDRRMQLMVKAQIDSLQKSFQAALERLTASRADLRPSLEAVTASQGTQAPEPHAEVRDDTEEDRVNAKEVEARAANEETACFNNEAEGHSANAKQKEDEAPSASSTPLGNIAPQDEALPTNATPTEQAQAASSAADKRLV